MFKLQAPYNPTGDQPKAIAQLVNGYNAGLNDQVLLGVTGSGKTFTMANVIQQLQKPTLIISHNKTLAAQLYQEFKEFFPKNAVEYFVSYYDFYQPESYLPATDTYIEKDADINDQIDKLRLSATTSLITRKDVIVIASVSCIYNIGSPAVYNELAIEVREGMKLRQKDLLLRLEQINYDRADFDFRRGTYRVVGEVVDVYPAYADEAIRMEIFDDKLVNLYYFDPLTGDTITSEYYKENKKSHNFRSLMEADKLNPSQNQNISRIVNIYPAKHYVTLLEKRASAIEQIKNDLDLRLRELRSMGKNIEAYRLEQRTNYDLEMIQEIGYCKGIENYSRYFDGREPGGTPYSLVDFFPKDYLLFIDESHITIPQIRGMYNGDQARKSVLVEYGFRLPSAMDNRPLNFEEFTSKMGKSLYASATPSEWEIQKSENHIAEQLIRPTGIVDPKILILPSHNQIKDLYNRIIERTERGERVLVTTLTKRMAEELSAFLSEKNVKVTYLHSDIETLERTNILDDLRKGNYDVLVGINLLREGLDLPEVSLVAILDADKEGFLRSDTSLIQTMGRAARHILGEVVMYADKVTGSMSRAISEVERRRQIQAQYNLEHNITPMQISKPIREKLVEGESEEIYESAYSKGNSSKTSVKDKSSKYYFSNEIDFQALPPKELKKVIKEMEKDMRYEAEMLNFEKAARVRDKIRDLKKLLDQSS